jgi:hypothetical protein
VIKSRGEGFRSGGLGGGGCSVSVCRMVEGRHRPCLPRPNTYTGVHEALVPWDWPVFEGSCAWHCDAIGRIGCPGFAGCVRPLCRVWVVIAGALLLVLHLLVPGDGQRPRAPARFRPQPH